MADYLVECGKKLSNWKKECENAKDKSTKAAEIIKREILPTVRYDVLSAASGIGIKNLEEHVKTFASKIPNQTLKDLIQCVSKGSINEDDAKKFLRVLYGWSGWTGAAAIKVALTILRTRIPISTKDEKVAKDIISIAGQASKSEM